MWLSGVGWVKNCLSGPVGAKNNNSVLSMLCLLLMMVMLMGALSNAVSFLTIMISAVRFKFEVSILSGEIR